jgi:hypothetical protein
MTLSPAVHVEHGAVARFVHAAIPGYPARDTVHVSQDLVIPGVQVVESRDVLLGNHQDMKRGLRVDVLEGVDAIVLEDLFRRYLTCKNAAEEAISHVGYFTPTGTSL